MPKETRLKSSSMDRAIVSPYGSVMMNLSSDSKSPLPAVHEKEWEETRCPICMEVPHNAVLLSCSSSNCSPFICDTSPLHSNCLDQFRKSSGKKQNDDHKLVCPLCRGTINKWTVVEEAQKFMNSKTRVCSLENCDFSGNYTELAEHGTREHPSVRPSEVSPTRQSNWAVLQQETDWEDARVHQYTDSESEMDYNPPRERRRRGIVRASDFFDEVSTVYSDSEDETEDWLEYETIDETD